MDQIDTLKNIVKDYEYILGLIVKMESKGSIVAGNILNTHNPSYLSQILKELDDAKRKDKGQGVDPGSVHSEDRPHGGK